MASPASRADFKAYCMRKLGFPIIEQINLTDEMIEDRIDEALKFYWDYHYDGTEKTYMKHAVTAEDKTNGYVTIPENIIGVVNVFNPGASQSTSNMFGLQYQIMLNDLWTLTTPTFSPYAVTMMQLSLIEDLIQGKKPMRYNRHRNRLHIDMDWSQIPVGSYLVFECYQIVDPDEFSNVWSDLWLQKYTCALLQYQWAHNLSKFTSVPLSGGLSLNVNGLMQEAKEMKEKLEHDMVFNYSLPVCEFIG